MNKARVRETRRCLECSYIVFTGQYLSVSIPSKVDFGTCPRDGSPLSTIFQAVIVEEGSIPADGIDRITDA